MHARLVSFSRRASRCWRRRAEQARVSARITLQGQVLSLDADDRKQATIKHEEIKGFMPAMTMPYKVEGRQGARRASRPGDLINATLVVVEQRRVPDGRQEGRRGAAREAGAEAPAGLVRLRAAEAGRGGSGRAVRRSGRQEAHVQRVQGLAGRDDLHLHAVPDADLLPADGSPFRRASRQTLKADPALKDVHLVSVSFDPATDTPAVLKKHAKTPRAPTPRAGRS